MTSREWETQDSALDMTLKYNETARKVSEMEDNNDQIPGIQQDLKRINKKLDSKLEEVSASDIGLGNVDNTSDKDKPVSDPQQRAINTAVREGMKLAVTCEDAPRNLGGVL